MGAASTPDVTQFCAHACIISFVVYCVNCSSCACVCVQVKNDIPAKILILSNVGFLKVVIGEMGTVKVRANVS